jgi:hypothetical protein
LPLLTVADFNKTVAIQAAGFADYSLITACAFSRRVIYPRSRL